MPTEQQLTLPGGCLLDRDMVLYDHKNKVSVPINWKEKDWDFNRIRSSFKQKTPSWEIWSEHIIPEFTPVSNQLDIGSCASNAVADMMEILDGLDGNDEVEQLSRLWLYWLARYLVGDTDKDEGSYIRANFHQLTKVGIIPEKHFPYLHANVYPKQVELDLYTMASNNRLTGFYRLTSIDAQRAMEVELAVRTNHPITFGTPVNTDFTKYSGGGQVWFPPENSWAGRHAMLVTGVRYVNASRQFLVRNSWGKNWGEFGHCWMDESYIMWAETQDLWVGTKCTPLN